jgi:hypothetical protein
MKKKIEKRLNGEDFTPLAYFFPRTQDLARIELITLSLDPTTIGTNTPFARFFLLLNNQKAQATYRKLHYSQKIKTFYLKINLDNMKFT